MNPSRISREQCVVQKVVTQNYQQVSVVDLSKKFANVSWEAPLDVSSKKEVDSLKDIVCVFWVFWGGIIFFRQSVEGNSVY